MYTCDVPTYAPDNELLAEIRRYVDERQGGVVMRAAEVLGLNYHMLRRFLERARAKPENRQRIREALKRAGWEFAKDHKVTREIPVQMTRSMLTQLLEALDVYQGTATSAGGSKA
jgi:hypothetical protein